MRFYVWLTTNERGNTSRCFEYMHGIIETIPSMRVHHVNCAKWLSLGLCRRAWRRHARQRGCSIALCLTARVISMIVRNVSDGKAGYHVGKVMIILRNTQLGHVTMGLRLFKGSVVTFESEYYMNRY